jgi:hypothetical protein
MPRAPQAVDPGRQAALFESCRFHKKLVTVRAIRAIHTCDVAWHDCTLFIARPSATSPCLGRTYPAGSGL